MARAWIPSTWAFGHQSIRLFHIVVGLAIVGTWLMRPPAMAADNPNEGDRNSIEFWRKAYEELLPASDPQAKRAHDIFHQVLLAAGPGPGLEPHLFISKRTLGNAVFALAIPDNWIVLSQGALELCYQKPEKGDARLAFVLAHEIAHQFKHDYQHVKFFQFLTTPKVEDPKQKEAFENFLKEIQTSAIVAEEREADEYGIFYMSLAGFNPEAIVPAGDAAHFFMAWLRSQDPFHPSPLERALAVKERLRKVAQSVDLFQVGLWFYHARDYARAVSAFEEFRKVFPSREVYLNLAASHHQLALENYRQWKKDKLALPWKLSLAIDPVTRASVIALRGSRSPAELFTEHLDKAIEFYQKAIAIDPFYALAYNNLGCALILKEDVYQAIAMLQKTLKIAPDFPEALNNLGVAFVAAEIPGKARPYLAKAHELAPGYEAPLFNLGKLADDEHNEAEVKQYWMAYLQLDPSSLWAEAIRQRLSLHQPIPIAPPATSSATEHLLGVQVGWFREDIPPEWGEPAQLSDIVLERDRFKMAVYQNRLLLLLLDDAIHLIATREGFQGSSARGVAAGSLAAELRAQYGPPSRILNMTQGASWVYEAQGIAFQLRDGKVVSWQLF